MDKSKKIALRVGAFASLVLAILIMIYAFLFLQNWVYKYGTCVKLPNGLIVSYEALFDFSKPYWIPEPVVRSIHGDIISFGNDEPFYFSNTTAFWVDYDRYPGQNEALAYRPDTGLIERSDNPKLYETLISEAGDLLEEGKRLNNTNVLGVLHFLRPSARYFSDDCNIPFRAR